jgi:hypothetical protein
MNREQETRRRIERRAAAKHRNGGVRERPEVARELGLTVEEVAAAEVSALTKCHRWAKVHGYKLSDLLPRLPVAA